MKCPCCGAAELIHDTRDVPYIYKGDATIIPGFRHGDLHSAAVLHKRQNALLIVRFSKCARFSSALNA